MSGNAKKIEEKFKNFTKKSKPGELLVVSKNNEGIQHIHTFTVTNTTNGTVSSSGAPTGKESAEMARARGAETLRRRKVFDNMKRKEEAAAARRRGEAMMRRKEEGRLQNNVRNNAVPSQLVQRDQRTIPIPEDVDGGRKSRKSRKSRKPRKPRKPKKSRKVRKGRKGKKSYKKH